MLLTPYAEIFGYQRDARFLTITLCSHVVFGFVMWLGLRYERIPASRLGPAWAVLGLVAVPLGLSAMAADFHALYRRKIADSPPAVMGPHLYVTWNVPEFDRVAAIWATRRFIDRDAVFHFVEPFETVRFGRPFDMPGAEVRRTGTESVTSNVLGARVSADSRLAALVRITDLTEVTPWMLSSNPETEDFVQRFRALANSHCGRNLSNACLAPLFEYVDQWYKKQREQP